MRVADHLVERLRSSLAAEHVVVRDDSERHVGHEGARGGGGHYTVVVVAACFAGLDLVARHRAVYGAVGEMIPGQIHALSILSYTPEEWKKRPGGRDDAA